MRAPEVRRPGRSLIRPTRRSPERAISRRVRPRHPSPRIQRETHMATSVLEALSNGLADAAERAGRSVVAVHARRRIPASGVLWRPGVVVATSHTIRRDDDITVALDGGRTVRATLAGRDQGTDLAVLRLEGSPDAPVATFGDPGAIRVGQLALAL